MCVNIDNGSQLQATLAEMTGQKTVPNVFISGQHVGKQTVFLRVLFTHGNEVMLNILLAGFFFYPECMH
jgi:glutaredoxin-related protein